MKDIIYNVLVIHPYYSYGKEKHTIKGESFERQISDQWTLDNVFPGLEFYEIFIKNKLISFK